MREILFRGKDLQERNGWLYGYFYKSDINKRERESGKATLIYTPNCDTFIYVPEYHNSWMVKPETVGQYTGLTDKNGTRIFEGDIIKQVIPHNLVRPFIFTVNWCEECTMFVLPCITNDAFESDFTVMRSDEIEVIGNIHDNGHPF